MTAEGPKPKTTDEIFKGKKVVLFAVPGAFTPTCNNTHLPGFLNNAAAIKAKGVDTIAVTGVNDVFVMEAWKKATGADGKIEFLGRRQRRIRQGDRHGLRRLRQRARHALQALFDAGRGRRGEETQHRGRARQVRNFRRPGAAGADLILFVIPGRPERAGPGIQMHNLNSLLDSGFACSARAPE